MGIQSTTICIFSKPEDGQKEQFNLEGVTEKRREWLVVTGNGCLNAFAHDAPSIVSGEFDDDS